jgi:hypothetical protein
MKTYLKILITGLFGALLFLSCRTDDQLTLDEIMPSKIDEVAVNKFILQEPATNTNPLLLTITWTQTQFMLSSSSHSEPGGPVNYVIQMDKEGNNFANPAVLASTNGLSADLFVKDINTILLNKLNATPDQENVVEIRIMTNYGQNKSVASTNILKLTITPYKPLEEVQAVYLLGDMNGWNNTSTEYIMYRNSNDPDDKTYTYTGRIAGNTYFKFIPQESLGTFKAYCRKDDTTMTYEEKSDGSFYNPTERYVTININIETLTYTIENYTGNNTTVFYNTMGPIGGFCNWDNEPLMTKSPYDGHQWSSTVTFGVSTACKFRANHDWATNWGGGAADYPYGKGVFDGPGANVSVTGTYKIYFNDLTGHYTILQQ